jgi:PAS domain S-box-containing protein
MTPSLPRVLRLSVPLLLCALTGAAVSPEVLRGQRLSVTSYTAAQGLPQMQVAAVHQTRDGFLWVGTWAGLSRFDGRVFDTWTIDDGLSVNAVVSLEETRSGVLAVGTYGGGICFLEGDRISGCLDSTDGLPSGEINTLVEIADGDLWAGTNAGAVLLREGRVVRTFDASDGLPDPAVHSVVQDDLHRIWIGTRSGSVRVEGDSLVTETAAPGGMVLAMTPAGLLFASNDGLQSWDPSGVGATLVAPTDPGVRVTEAEVAADGTIWVGTTSGALRIESGAPSLITRRSGLPGDQVNDIHVDREDNVWFGTEYGLAKLVPGPFLFFTEQDGMPSPWIGAVAEDHDGRVWVSTSLGPAYLASDGFHDGGRPLGDSNILANGLAAAPEGGVLLGSLRGLFHLRVGADGIRRTEIGSGLEVEHLLEDGGGVLVATADGLLRWEGGRLYEPGLPPLDGRPVSLARDTSGRLWVGLMAGGVRILEPGSMRRLGAAEGLTDQAVWALEPTPEGGMWVGSNGDGAFLVRGDSIARLGRDDGLASDFVWQLLRDRTGSLWIFTGHGMNRIADGQMHSYGTGQGLTDLEGSASAALEDAQGRLWFGTGSGVYRYEPSLDRPNMMAPPVYITGLAADGVPYPLVGARIPPGVGVLHVRASAPSFRDESAVRFSYRLTRLGGAWSPPSAEAGVTLAGLPPGRHMVEVRAFNDRGVASLAAASLEFTVLPRFWQTLWFRGAVLLLIVLTLSGIPWARARRLKAEREEAKAALRESEQRLRDIVEHSSNLFYAHGPDHVLTYVSPQSRSFLGCEPEEAMVAWPDFLTDHPGNATGIASTERALATGQAQPPFELELKRADGRKVRVEVREAPVVRDGRTVAIVGSLTDVTEVRSAAEEKHRLEAQLQQGRRLEALGRLAGGIAHDFNNLLTTVLGHAQLLKDDVPDGPLQESLGDIESAAHRGAGLVQQLLAFGRRQIVTPERLDLNEAVQESARMLARVIGDSVVIHWKPAESPLLVQADRTQVALAIINLAVNARDAMPGGGELTMAAQRVDLAEARAYPGPDEVPPGVYAELTLADTGTGIDPAILDHVFEPFFTTKGVGSGTGLGLATVYGAIKQSGGHVQVETKPGKGSTFHILLPLMES